VFDSALVEGCPKMVTLSLTRLAAAIGGLAFSVTATAGIASADPDLNPIINTTCNYSQVVAALRAESPAAAAQFNSSPMAQSWLRSFLASPPAQRQQMAQQVEAMPSARPYLGVAVQAANSCNNY
jgi:hemophore-related protein